MTVEGRARGARDHSCDPGSAKRRAPLKRHSRRLARLSIAAVTLLSVSSLGSQLTAGASDSDVVRGGANASADSLAFNIVNAGASLGWTFGRSTAAYRDITATSEGKAVDLGALEALLGQPQCGGQIPPALDMDSLPPRTISDSTTAGSEQKATASVSYPKLADDKTADREVGTQWSSATREPSSSSGTRTLNQDFGFFSVEGAESSATTSFKDGIRLAEAETSAKRIVVFGGQVEFYGPRWTARAWSGSDSGSQSSFTFDAAMVFGNFVTGANLKRDLAFFESLIEGLLSPLGLDMQFPETRKPFAAEGVEISPLTFKMSNAPIGSDLLIPLLNTELLQNYRVESVDEDCRRETFWTIVDALERALGGSGAIEMSVGGATATTDDTDYSSKPFGEQTTTDGPSNTAAPSVPGDPGSAGYTGDLTDTGLDYTTEDFGTDLSSDFGSELDTGFNSDLGDLGTTDLGGLGDEQPVAEVAGATSDRGAPDAGLEDTMEIAAGSKGNEGGSNTAAVVVGVAALLGALALSMGDRIMGLRARRRIS